VVGADSLPNTCCLEMHQGDMGSFGASTINGLLPTFLQQTHCIHALLLSMHYALTPAPTLPPEPWFSQQTTSQVVLLL
jgi:hypothetical protein